MDRLYAILDADVAARGGFTLEDLARAYLRGGARLLQVRAKGLGSGPLLETCERIVADARAFDARVIVNDRADVARLARAWGVHVGQADLRPAAARAIVGPGAIVGLSTHTPEQIDAAASEPIDYVAVGPIYGTRTKDTGYEAGGLELVRYAARERLPVVAIGGITLDRAREVIEAGAASVAVITDLLVGGDPEARVREYLEQLRARQG